LTGLVEIAVAAGAGGGGTLLLQTLNAWFRTRTEDRRSKLELGAKLDEHRDQLTFDLLTAAREEMKELRAEVSELRPISLRVAHLEEALDHIHALLHAEGDAEKRAAERRAKAYLRRMRPEIGDLRNSAQAASSAKAVLKRVINEKPGDTE
jgi:hypothetical protein